MLNPRGPYFREVTNNQTEQPYKLRSCRATQLIKIIRTIADYILTRFNKLPSIMLTNEQYVAYTPVYHRLELVPV